MDRGQFNGTNATMYLKYYEQLIEQYGLLEDHKKDTFIRIFHGFTKERIQLRVVLPNMTWANFKTQLLTQFSQEGYSKNKRSTFMRWVGTTKTDQHITQGLIEVDRTALEPDKLGNFLSMLVVSLRCELEPMLEDRTTTSGLIGYWENVRAAVHRVAQRQERNQMQTPRLNDKDVLVKIENDNTLQNLAKHMKTFTIEMETIKSMEEIRLREQEIPRELEQNPRTQMPNRRTFNQARRCLWCDEVDRKICDYVTKRPLATNYGKGGMKNFFEASTSQNTYSRFFMHKC
ncbi:hypothetical protein KP509_23G064300 [Ceratopteris richardii]|uniref:Uncharacterized protein n=1 Tax=Ceratopteris richardii TaxID=49495 RepID=A0A8T2S3Q9_CERRI|nr:hypothetical protein KP509_23G064300 [Ceratopteris richardii]